MVLIRNATLQLVQGVLVLLVSQSLLTSGTGTSTGITRTTTPTSTRIVEVQVEVLTCVGAAPSVQ